MGDCERQSGYSRQTAPARVRPSTHGAFGSTAADFVSPDAYDGAATADAPSAWRRHRLTRVDYAAAVVILLAALAVRWPFIVKGETLLHSDEAIVGLMAQDIAAGERFPIYFYGQRYMGALEAYVIAAVSPFFDNPIHALRFGPACFFAWLAAVQYLMLTRWFGRRGGLIGAVALLAAAPMFAQWSISARGGYIEILLWGSMLLWAYGEWFAADAVRSVGSAVRTTDAVSRQPFRRGGSSTAVSQISRAPGQSRRRFLFGLLIGSGLWINPAIVLFIVPIVLHAMLNRPLAALLESPRVGRRLSRAATSLGVAALPVAVLLMVLAMNSVWAVWIENGKPRNLLFLGLLPRLPALLVLGVCAAVTALVLTRKTTVLARVRQAAARHGLMIFGMLVGAAPALWYVVQTVLGLRPMDPSIPLGIRPLWLAGETTNYLLYGLPLLFGADPRPFLQLVTIGHDSTVQPLGLLTAGCVSGANWLVLGSAATCCVVLAAAYRGEILRLLRLRPTNHSPGMLLILGFLTAIGLYVLGGCALDFTSIRYLVPVWAFVPGLIAAVFVSPRLRLASHLAPVALCCAWAVGQIAMAGQLGNPHPLRRLASAMTEKHLDLAVAELFDAHLLSYLSQQKCRTIEFEPFWARLNHYRAEMRKGAPTDYIVNSRETDRPRGWIAGGWPGESPPETKRFLWPRLRRAILACPDLLVERMPLTDGYERIRLRAPLPERNNQP